MGFFASNEVSKNSEDSLLNQKFYRHEDANQGRIARPNFSKVQLSNVEIPYQISKEIRAEKFRLFNIILINTLFFLVGLTFALIHFLAPVENESQLKIPLKFIPHPAFSIILGIIGLIFGLMAIIDQVNLKIDLRSYKSDLLMKIEKIPYFLIKNYRNLLVRPIYLNWLAAVTYLGLGVTIGIFYIIRAASKGSIKLETELIIMFCLLGIMFFIQVVTLIQTRASKGRITSYYGYEIVSFDEAKALKKTANRRCLVLFLILLSVVLFVVVIPYLILRRSKGKRVVPRL